MSNELLYKINVLYADKTLSDLLCYTYYALGTVIWVCTVYTLALLKFTNSKNFYTEYKLIKPL